MQKVFDDPILLMKLLSDNELFLYKTKEMRMFKSTSRLNNYRINNVLDMYKPKNDKMFEIFNNNKLLKKILDYTRIIEPENNNENNLFGFFNKNLIKLKNLSKKFNINIRNFLITYIKNNKKLIKSMYPLIGFKSNKIFFDYILNSLYENCFLGRKGIKGLYHKIPDEYKYPSCIACEQECFEDQLYCEFHCFSVWTTIDCYEDIDINDTFFDDFDDEKIDKATNYRLCYCCSYEIVSNRGLFNHENIFCQKCYEKYGEEKCYEISRDYHNIIIKPGILNEKDIENYFS